MKKFKHIIITLILILSLFTFQNNLIVKADSGFGGSYSGGGGSSSSGGSSWSSSSSSHNSSSSNNSSSNEPAIVIFIGNLLMLLIFGWLTIYCYKDIKKFNIRQKNKQEEKKKKIDSIIGTDHLKYQKQLFEIYKNIQIAWMNFDEEELRKYVTDEMFNMYSSQLETLKVKNQQNIMENMKLKSFSIEDVIEENGNIILTTNMKVECNDYIIDTNTKKVVKGDKDVSVIYDYEIIFIKNKNKLTSKKCPNCGSKITKNASNKCEYCNSIIILNSDNWVMSKKEVLVQWNGEK